MNEKFEGEKNEFSTCNRPFSVIAVDTYIIGGIILVYVLLCVGVPPEVRSLLSEAWW